MKNLIFIFLTFVSIICDAQITDTTLYFMDSFLVNKASYHNSQKELINVANSLFVLVEKRLESDSVFTVHQSDPYKEVRTTFNDSVYFIRNIYPSCCDRKSYHSENESKVVYTKEGDGYLIKVTDSNEFLFSTGTSKTSCPIVWDGSLATFHKDSGTLKSIQYFDNGRKDSTQYFDTKGRLIQLPVTKVDKEPSLKYSKKSFEEVIISHLIKNYNFPKKALDNWQSQVIYVGIIVSKVGTIENVFLLREHELFEEEITSSLKFLPQFEPATINNKPVNFIYYFPVRHNID